MPGSEKFGSSNDRAKTKVLIVEFGIWHFDVIYSWYHLLKDEVEVQLFISEELGKKLPKELINKCKTFLFKGQSELKSISSRWKLLKKYRSHIKNESITHVLFNTCQGSLAHSFSWGTPSGVCCLGVHHNPNKLVEFGSQSFINLKVKKYIVLTDYLKKNLISSGTSVNIESIYPIYFPEENDLSVNNKVPEKQGGDIWVCLPGAVEQSRRVYFGLIDLIKNSKLKLDHKIKFLVLGDSNKGDGKEIRARVQNANLQNYFYFFEGFVENSVLFSCLKKSDLIATLLHPNLGFFELYKKLKMTGTYSLAFGFGKPLLLHSEFKEIEEFSDVAIFYSTVVAKEQVSADQVGDASRGPSDRADGLIEILNGLASDSAKKQSVFEKIDRNMTHHASQNLTLQRKKMLSLFQTEA